MTTTISETAAVGDAKLGTSDGSLPGLAFWSVDRLGDDSFGVVFAELRARTLKPFLISAFGVDAYDGSAEAADVEAQADSARAGAFDIQIRTGGTVFPVLGGIWDGFVDQWWRAGDPDGQDTIGRPSEAFPDGRYHAEWMGLFETAPTNAAGFDRLKPRPAYFALAEVWGGAPPGELSLPDPPEIETGGVVNLADGGPLNRAGRIGFAARVELGRSKSFGRRRATAASTGSYQRLPRRPPLSPAAGRSRGDSRSSTVGDHTGPRRSHCLPRRGAEQRRAGRDFRACAGHL